MEGEEEEAGGEWKLKGAKPFREATRGRTGGKSVETQFVERDRRRSSGTRSKRQKRAGKEEEGKGGRREEEGGGELRVEG